MFQLMQNRSQEKPIKYCAVGEDKQGFTFVADIKVAKTATYGLKPG